MKIVGYTVGTPLPKPNFDQTDPRKGDFIKGDRSFLNMDDSLAHSGRPADAKATGDAINSIQAQIDTKIDSVNDSIYEARQDAESGDASTLELSKQYTDNAVAQRAQVQIITWGADD